MRRAASSMALAVGMVVGTAGIATAATPAKACSNSEFQSIQLYEAYDHGEPIPAGGVDAWWDLTVSGFEAEGLTADEAATLFGFASSVDLYEAVNSGILDVDTNGDGAVCWKPFPETSNGKTAFFFNVVDNNARAH